MNNQELTFTDILAASGMSLKALCEFFEIPYSTAMHWKRGERECPEYLLKLMLYRLKKERH